MDVSIEFHDDTLTHFSNSGIHPDNVSDRLLKLIDLLMRKGHTPLQNDVLTVNGARPSQPHPVQLRIARKEWVFVYEGDEPALRFYMVSMS